MNIFHIQNADKLVHMFMYFFFTITIAFEHKIKNLRHYIFSGAAAFVFGLMIEIFQPLINPARTGETTDVLFNLTGITAALITWYLISRLLRDL